MIPTKPTKDGSIDKATGTDAKSYAERQKQKTLDAKKQALKGLEDVASSKEKEQLQTVLESIIDMIVEQEAEENDLFGKYLFGQQRKSHPAKSEPNTEEEQEFLDSLDDWVVNNRDKPLASMFEEVWSLVQQGKYASMLKPEDRPLYRVVSGYNAAKSLGVTKNPTFQEKIRALDDGVDLDEVLDGMPFKVDVSLSVPKHGKELQSWGVETQTLQNFMNGGEVCILMKTSPSPSNGKFLLNPYSLVSELDQSGEYQAMINYLEIEGEVISFGPVKVEAAVAAFVPLQRGTSALRRILAEMRNLLESGNG